MSLIRPLSRQRRDRVTRRVFVISGISLLHVAVGYAFSQGWMVRPEQPESRHIEVVLLEDPRPPEDPPPHPHVSLAMPDIPTVVMPPVVITMPTEDVPTVPAAELVSRGRSHPPDETPAGSPIVEDNPPSVHSRAHFIEPINPNRYYPPLSKRVGEHGLVQLNVCVNADGSYDGSPLVKTSSGYPRIDQAGVVLVRDNAMVPELVNGKPIHSCTMLEIEFTLPR